MTRPLSSPLERSPDADHPRPALAFGWLLAIIVVALVARAPGFQNGFVNYDDPQIRAEVASKTPIEFFTGATYYAYVPIYGLSLWLDHHLFAESPVGPHVINGLLFALAAALTALVLNGMLRRPFVAVGAALLLAVHPVHTENVAWVAERKDALSFVLVLLAHLSYRERRAVAPDRAPLLAPLLLLLGGWSKATVWSYVGVIVIDELLASTKGRFRRLAPLVGVAVVGAAHAAWFGMAYGPGAVAHPATNLELAAAASGVHLRYLFSLVWPAGLSVDYPVDPAGSFADPFAIGGVLLLVAALVGLLLGVVHRRPLLATVCGLWVLGLAPVNEVWPKTSILRADRYLLIPAVGAYALFVAATARLGRARVAVVGAVVVVLGFLATGRATVFASSDALWSDVLSKHPTSAVARINRAADAAERGDWARADEDAQAGADAALAMKRPELALRARLIRALALLERAASAGDQSGAFIDRSLVEAKQAVGLADSFVRTPWVTGDPRVMRAAAHAAVGQALETRSRSGIDPTLAAEDRSGAMDAYRLAVGSDAKSFDAWTNLGNLLATSGGEKRLVEAADVLQRAHLLRPDHVETIVQLVTVLYKLHRDVEAKSLLDEAAARFAREPAKMRGLKRLAAKLEAETGSNPDVADRKLSELWKADSTDAESRNLLHALRRTRALEALAALRTAAEPGSEARKKAVEAAVKAYDRVLEMAPGDADAQIGAGDALFQVGDFAAARGRYEKAIVCAPTSIWIRNLAARAGLLEALSLSRGGKPDEAAHVVARVVLLGPPRLDLGFASLDAELTRLVPAAQALTDGTGVEPAIASLVLLGAALLVGGAEAGDAKATRDDPGDGAPPEDGAEASFRRATSLLGGPAPSGSRLEALADTAILLRAVVRGRRADVEGARSDLETIRTRYPSEPLVRYHLILLDRLTASAKGRIADATGDKPGVLAARTLESSTLANAERLADASPPWAGPGLLVAEMQLQRGEFLDALRRLSGLGEHFPLEGAVHRGIAAVYQAQMLQSGARDTMLLQQAREALTRAKEIDPRDPRTALDMSQLYRLAGDLETAARNALQARSVEPIAGPASQAFAAIRVEQGRKALEKHEIEKATAYAKDAAEADDRSAAPFVLDGEIAIALQDLKRALTSFLRAREIDPSSHDAVRALADCRRRRGAAYFAWKIVHGEPKGVGGVAPDPRTVADWRKKNLAALRQAIGEFEASLRLEPEGPDAEASRERLEQLSRELHRLDPASHERDMTTAQLAFEDGEKLRRDEHFVDALEKYRAAVASWSEFLPGWVRIAEMAIAIGADHDVEGFRAIDVIRDLDGKGEYPEPDLYAGELWFRRANAVGGAAPLVADARRRARMSLERFLSRARLLGDRQRVNVERAETLLGRLGR